MYITPVGKTDYLVQAQLTNEFVTLTTSMWLGLYTTIPTAAGTGTEVTLNGYARVSAACGSTNWQWNASKYVENKLDIVFPQLLEGDPASEIYAKAVATCDAASSGHILRVAPLITGGVPFTATATDDVLLAVGHAFTNGDKLLVWGSALPSGLTTLTEYFAINVSTNTLKLSATSGGAAVNITTDAAGFIAKTDYLPLVIKGKPTLSANQVKFYES